VPDDFCTKEDVMLIRSLTDMSLLTNTDNLSHLFEINTHEFIENMTRAVIRMRIVCYQQQGWNKQVDKIAKNFWWCLPELIQKDFK
jgi:hypothetical protein